MDFTTTTTPNNYEISMEEVQLQPIPEISAHQYYILLGKYKTILMLGKNHKVLLAKLVSQYEQLKSVNKLVNPIELYLQFSHFKLENKLAINHIRHGLIKTIMSHRNKICKTTKLLQRSKNRMHIKTAKQTLQTSSTILESTVTKYYKILSKIRYVETNMMCILENIVSLLLSQDKTIDYIRKCISSHPQLTSNYTKSGLFKKFNESLNGLKIRAQENPFNNPLDQMVKAYIQHFERLLLYYSLNMPFQRLHKNTNPLMML